MKTLVEQTPPRYCKFSGRFINHLRSNALFLNKEYRYMYKVQQDYKKNLENYKDNTDLPRCKICGFVCDNLLGHIVQGHKISIDLYKSWFGDNVKVISDSMSSKLSKAVSGKNNPGYNHGGRLSPFSNKFLKKDHNREDTFKKCAASRKRNNNDTTTLGYYTSRGFTEEESKKLLSERQSTFSKEKCIKKYGEIEGIKVWKTRQEKWQKNYKHSNFSKVSQRLFWKIYESIKDCYNEIFFAELDNNKTPDKSGKNHEYRLSLNNILILPDFFIKDISKIIEFDGTYYHRNNPENKKREDTRDKEIKESGFDVLHITESEFNNNEDVTVMKCIEFIKG